MIHGQIHPNSMTCPWLSIDISIFPRFLIALAKNELEVGKPNKIWKLIFLIFTKLVKIIIFFLLSPQKKSSVLGTCVQSWGDNHFDKVISARLLYPALLPNVSVRIALWVFHASIIGSLMAQGSEAFFLEKVWKCNACQNLQHPMKSANNCPQNSFSLSWPAYHVYPKSDKYQANYHC